MSLVMKSKSKSPSNVTPKGGYKKTKMVSNDQVETLAVTDKVHRKHVTKTPVTGRATFRELSNNVATSTPIENTDHGLSGSENTETPTSAIKKRRLSTSENEAVISKTKRVKNDPAIEDNQNSKSDISNNNSIMSLDDDIDRDKISITNRRIDSKKLADQLQTREKQKEHYLQVFQNISVSYSVFLQRKISTSKPGTSKSTDESDGSRPDILERMKYFVGTLRPHQIEGVTWLTILYENSVNGVLADEMGLGKTIQIIALFCHLYERKVKGPFLVVCPLSTLGNWESEFKRFAPQIPVVLLQGDKYERMEQVRYIQKTKFRLDSHIVEPVVICSYQVPLSEQTFFAAYKWQYIVVDEGQRIKNSESLLSQELRALKSTNRTLLTGTPLQNDFKELWSLFNFLMPDLFNDLEGFASLLELEDVRNKNKLLEDEARNKVISTIHKTLAPFMLRRTKMEVLTDLVPKKEMLIYCSLTEMQNYLYRAVLQKDVGKLSMVMEESENLDEGNVKLKRKCRSTKINYNVQSDIPSGHLKNHRVVWIDKRLEQASEMSGKLHNTSKMIHSIKHIPIKIPNCPYMTNIKLQNTAMMLKQIANHPYLIWTPIDPNTKKNSLYVSEEMVKNSGKLLVLDALLPKLKANGHKVLIFSTLTMFLDIIEELLIMRGYQYARLDGQVRYTERNENIEKFMDVPDVFIFLLSTRAGGLGLNLTAADTVIFMDRDWNPMADLQAQDRCHRIGQTKPVMIYSLINKGTIDEIILNRGDMKRKLEKIVMQDDKLKKGKNFNLDDDELKDLENLLNSEEKLLRIRSNGLIYSDKELDQILDRTELYQEWENQKASCSGKKDKLGKTD